MVKARLLIDCNKQIFDSPKSQDFFEKRDNSNLQSEKSDETHGNILQVSLFE